ncbi:MAG: COX15/CtaA family protein [Rhodothermales bacterium]
MTHHGEVLPTTNTALWRHRFTVLTAATTVLLLAWGAFVTSINAGLAVPDWPSSFNSFDPFNPWPNWWTITPVLAEHGHRLLGALVGSFTFVLAVWTVFKDERRWMKILAVAALVLVTLQGVLGGLRVVLISLDLAVVHACVAQIYFALIVSMAVFTSKSWLQGDFGDEGSGHVSAFRRLTLVTVGVLYVQIILGALLRHPGTGIDPLFAGLHIAGAVAATTAITMLYRYARRHHPGTRIAFPAARALLILLIVQFTLGVTAYVVTLDDTGILQPSNLQVVVNTSHMVTGALLMAAAVVVALDAFRLPLLESATARIERAESSILRRETVRR